jgi:hypothetical protein
VAVNINIAKYCKFRQGTEGQYQSAMRRSCTLGHKADYGETHCRNDVDGCRETRERSAVNVRRGFGASIAIHHFCIVPVKPCNGGE